MNLDSVGRPEFCSVSSPDTLIKVALRPAGSLVCMGRTDVTNFCSFGLVAPNLFFGGS